MPEGWLARLSGLFSPYSSAESLLICHFTLKRKKERKNENSWSFNAVEVLRQNMACSFNHFLSHFPSFLHPVIPLVLHLIILFSPFLAHFPSLLLHPFILLLPHIIVLFSPSFLTSLRHFFAHSLSSSSPSHCTIFPFPFPLPSVSFSPIHPSSGSSHSNIFPFPISFSSVTISPFPFHSGSSHNAIFPFPPFFSLLRFPHSILVFPWLNTGSYATCVFCLHSSRLNLHHLVLS